jgi:hypothetical protein
VWRSVSILAEYGYYGYNVPAGATTLPIPTNMRGQYIMAGVNVGMAFLDRRRPVDDSR